MCIRCPGSVLLLGSCLSSLSFFSCVSFVLSSPSVSSCVSRLLSRFLHIVSHFALLCSISLIFSMFSRTPPPHCFRLNFAECCLRSAFSLFLVSSSMSFLRRSVIICLSRWHSAGAPAGLMLCLMGRASRRIPQGSVMSYSCAGTPVQSKISSLLFVVSWRREVVTMPSFTFSLLRFTNSGRPWTRCRPMQR